MDTAVLNKKDRVRENTATLVNFQIDKDAFARIRQLRREGKPAILSRIAELDHEWDVERTLAIHGAALALAGVVLGATVNKKWLFLTGAVAAVLGQQAIQGWSAPVPLLRQLGVRTRREIDEEREFLGRLI